MRARTGLLISILAASFILMQAQILGPVLMSPVNTPAPSIAFVQKVFGNWSTGSSISITLAQALITNTHHFLIIADATNQTASRISTISVGGTLVPCAANAGTWGAAGTCYSGSGTGGQGLGSVDGGWVIGTTATAGPVVVNYTGALSAGSAILYEYTCTNGTITADTAGTRDSSTDTTPFPGPTLTLTGTNDVKLDWADGHTVDPTSAAAPFADFLSANGIGATDHLNTNSGAGASYTAASNTGGSSSGSIAIKCQ